MDLSRTEEFPVLVHRQQPRCLIGMGAHELAAPLAAGMGLKHVLLVTSGLSGTGIVDELTGQFDDAGVAVTVYDKVESNPKDYNGCSPAISSTSTMEVVRTAADLGSFAEGLLAGASAGR